jgi:hypothetical protein
MYILIQPLRTKQEEYDEAVVAAYLAALESAFSAFLYDEDEDGFRAVFDQLEADGSVGQAEAVAIASEFMSPTSRGTSRQAALDKIWERFETLLESRNRTRAGPGA